MIEMLKSLYAYNYGTNNKYFKELVKKYGASEVFKKWNEIKNTYIVEKNTGTDAEGNTYNSLKKRSDV